jgi:DHA2 family multidrug resistance protein
VTHINPFNPLLANPDFVMPGGIGSPEGLAIVDHLVQREALMLGYLQDFRLMTLMTCLAIPLVLALRPVRHADA